MFKKLFEEVINSEFKNDVYAHRVDEKYECLLDHSLLSLTMFREIKKDTIKILSRTLSLDEVIINYLVESAVFMHDFGKSTPYFQFNKMNHGKAPINNLSHLSYHSQLSAVYYFDQMIKYVEENVETKESDYFIIMFILTECIAKHHSNLSNLEDFATELDEYMLDLVNSKNHTELFNYFNYTPEFISIKNFASLNFKELLVEASENFLEIAYDCGLIFFSLLTTSDILATKRFTQSFRFKEDVYDVGLKSYFTLSYNQSELNQYIIDYKKKDTEGEKNLNDIRSEFIIELDDKLKMITERDQLFHLEGVVGIGKTHASQRFVGHMLNHAAVDKVYWSVPYLSIANQLDDANKKLDKQAVQLDSTTPIRYEYTDFNIDYSKMVVNDQLMNYRNATFTFVRFFNLLFSHSKSNALRRLSLRNSVIVIDELQSIDILLMNQFLFQIEQMSKLLNIKVLFMSATLPRFAQTMPLTDPEKFRNEPLLTGRNSLNFEFYDKKMSHLDILTQLNIERKRVLIQTVTKKEAQAVYEELTDKHATVYLYTGDTKKQEREKIIRLLQDKKVTGEYANQEVILVTTNAIEAGVDISMNMAIVSLTSIDSLEQLSGRVNRNNEFSSSESILYVTNKEKADFLSPIKTNYTRSLGTKKLSELFQGKNYNDFMSAVLSQAKKSQKNINQLESVRKLEFKNISLLMKLITTGSCFYYHIKDERSQNLMNEYKVYSEKIKQDIQNYDEYYIKRKEVMIELNDYKHVIKEKKYMTLFVEKYRDESVVFYENNQTFEENNKVSEEK